MSCSRENAETLETYLSVVNAAISSTCHSPGVGTKLRPDVVDALKRKWIAALKSRMQFICSSTRDSDPRSVVMREEYTTRPDLIVANHSASESSGDDFSDDFDDADFQHATNLGRKQAEDAQRAEAARIIREQEKKRKIEALEARKEQELAELDFEPLDDSLKDVDIYMEPEACSMRILAQTEVCDSTGKRQDSRWLVVLLNGILRFPGKCEILFRSARQTFSHSQK